MIIITIIIWSQSQTDFSTLWSCVHPPYWSPYLAEMDWSFIQHPTNLTVRRGENVTLTCRAPLSRPAALVSWFKNNHPFTPTDHATLLHNGDLFFHRQFLLVSWIKKKRRHGFWWLSLKILRVTTSACSAQESDSGNYFCRASNIHLQRFLASRRATLTVQGAAARWTRHMMPLPVLASRWFFFKPTSSLGSAPPSVKIWPQVLTVPVGARVLLECAVSGQPSPSISWLKRGHSKHTGGKIAVG